MTPEEITICLRAAEAGWFSEVWLRAYEGSPGTVARRKDLAARAAELLGERTRPRLTQWFLNALGPENFRRGGSDLWQAMRKAVR